jgi:hypothetical protein
LLPAKIGGILHNRKEKIMPYVVECYTPSTVTDPLTGSVHILDVYGEMVGYALSTKNHASWEVVPSPCYFTLKPDVGEITTFLREEEGEDLTLCLVECSLIT